MIYKYSGREMFSVRCIFMRNAGGICGKNMQKRTRTGKFFPLPGILYYDIIT